MATGTVKWFNDTKGFGFITQDGGGEDVFCHHTAIKADGFRTLAEGQKVEFDVVKGPKGLIQPALKVRGREYLRIIYGPEYDAPEHLVRLCERGLNGKRNLALREFALGHEALKRFVAGEPLRRVHECVFGVLAMESEPIDPRL